MFSRIGAAAIKKDLTNTIMLCDFLQNPHNKFKTIHVAGTNGKGSVSHMLAAIMQTAGYKTGLYTSPHLKDFRERIKINGEMIDENSVVDFVEHIKPMIEKIEPSFFEITVAMAFEYFAKKQIDIAIVEVGLGGRLDSTNIITPEVSVITNIGWDHMNILGDTLEKIAYEKAGIIKKQIPAVIGESSPATKKVFEEKARQENAKIYFADHHHYAADWKFQHHELVVQVADTLTDERKNYRLDLPGFYQTKNLITVLETIKVLKEKGWKFTQQQIHEALQHVKKLTGLHGRWDIIHHHPTVVLDVGHNEDGIKQITAQIELTDYDNLHIVIGMVKDKEVEKVLSLLPKEAKYYFTKAQIPRALPEKQLAEKAKTAGLSGNFYPDVNTALKDAIQHADKKDLILVCGSVFVVGEVNMQM